LLIRKRTSQDPPSVTTRLHNATLTLPHKGIFVTLIDFTFSRINTGAHGVLSTDLALGGSPIGSGGLVPSVGCCRLYSLEVLSDKPAKKLGWSDPRGLHYNVYSQMQQMTGGVWDKYVPRSNVLWIQCE
jgi:hypothetical protein